MTCGDYNVTMKGIGIADLKARLSEHLRAVRTGRSITVLDRNAPVARLVPVEDGPLEVRKATRRPRDMRRAKKLDRPVDSLAVLLDDRRRR